MKEKGFEIKKDTSEVYCRLFKDNSNDLEIKKCTNYDHAQTKMDFKLQHFSSYVRNFGINIHNIWAIISSSGPASVTIYNYYYWVMVFQTTTLVTMSLDSVPIVC